MCVTGQSGLGKRFGYGGTDGHVHVDAAVSNRTLSSFDVCVAEVSVVVAWYFETEPGHGNDS